MAPSDDTEQPVESPVFPPVIDGGFIAVSSSSPLQVIL